jgi:cell wall-associated NlpC family hydrolase
MLQQARRAPQARRSHRGPSQSHPHRLDQGGRSEEDELLVRRALILALLALAAALAGCGADREQEASAPHVKAAAHATEQPPLPKPRPKVVEPVAGRVSAAAAKDDSAASDSVAPPDDGPKPTGPASEATRSRGAAPSAINGGTHNATALDNGVALPPLEAPAEVLKIIEAGNAIARTPYKWGGGHGRFLDTGYDCSGSVSFALYAAGLIGGPSDSSGLMHWGKPGRGKWVTIYANPGHVYMEVAGIRFDTSGAKQTGSRWQNDLRGGAGGFVARHPSGL